MTMVHGPQGIRRRHPLLWFALGTPVAVVLVYLVWQALFAALAPRISENYLIGKWRVEETSVLGLALPVGLQLEFGPNSAMVLDQRVTVSSYEVEKGRIAAILVAPGGLSVTLPFRVLETDRIAYEGPFGMTVKYRRMRGTS